ncbi:hypothetical protein BDY19DRAFT_701101 [Irpex rosettiformis]|uniref:Uncharacterized protein n=1 Tax=Irpex rosettiformis TaxID=378272 RepID=A0ACB8UAF3_9APHY|nr:hypothetical protein BDY19DRAFT_701101 [Irpex rosettiformis]
MANLLTNYLGGKDKGSRRNSLPKTMASGSVSERGTTEYPRYSRDINLNTDRIVDGEANLYALLLSHLQNVWRDQLVLVPETAPPNLGEPLVMSSIRAYRYVTFNGLQYGSGIKHGGFPYCHGYIEGHVPVRIAVILRVKHIRPNANLPPLEHTCAIVQRFVRHPNTPSMPWDLHAIDLGIGVWNVDKLHQPEVIEITRMSGHFALGTVRYRSRSFWVSMSVCHDAQEPDAVLNVNAERNEEEDDL